MSVNSVLLTVASQNNQNLATTVPTVFEVSKMGSIRANQNAATTPTFTPASALGTSLWNIQFEKGAIRPTKLYFSVTDNGSTNDCALYLDSSLTKLVAKTDTAVGDAAVASLITKNNSGISGNVTLAGSNTGSSYLTIALESADADLELAGATEFSYLEPTGVVKYTVSETVSAIQTAIAGADSFLEATLTLTTAQVKAMNTTPIEIIAAPAAGSIIEVISGVVFLDYGSAGYATHDDVDLAYTSAPTVKCATADAGLAGTADKYTKIIPIAGALKAADGISITDVDGNPATGDSPITVKVTYKVTVI